jgi:hypothetical protein
MAEPCLVLVSPLDIFSILRYNSPKKTKIITKEVYFMINFKKRRSPLLIVGILLILVMSFTFLGCPEPDDPDDPNPNPNPNPNPSPGRSAVTTKLIPGILLPVGDAAAPATVTTNPQYTGTITWTPAHATFVTGTSYTATIVLTATSSYTFDGVTLTDFTAAGVPCGTGVKSGETVTFSDVPMGEASPPSVPVGPHYHTFDGFPNSTSTYEWRVDTLTPLGPGVNGRQYQVCDGSNGTSGNHTNLPLYQYRTLWATGSATLEYVGYTSAGVVIPDSDTTTVPAYYGVKAGATTTATVHIPAMHNSKAPGDTGFVYANYKPVQVIENSAFNGKTTVTDVVFLLGRNTADTLDEYKLTRIGQNAFQSTAIATSAINASANAVTANSITNNATGINEVIIPPTVTFIGANAFANIATLKKITIPASVTEVEDKVFGGDGITVSPLVEVILSQRNINDDMFKWVTASLTTVTLNSGVQKIGARAFQGCGEILSVYIPSTVNDIGLQAFDGCVKLATLSISTPSNVIGTTFRSLTSLRTVIIGQGVTTIPANAFENSAITNLTISNSVATIGADAFKKAELTDLTIFTTSITKEWLANFGVDSPLGDSLERLTIGNGGAGQTIGEGAFEEYGELATLTFGTTAGNVITPVTALTRIDESAFRGCEKLKTINNIATASTILPTGLTTIGINAFGAKSGAGAEKNIIDLITIPSTVTTVGRAAFSGIPATNTTDARIRIVTSKASEADITAEWGAYWKEGYTGAILLIR